MQPGPYGPPPSSPVPPGQPSWPTGPPAAPMPPPMAPPGGPVKPSGWWYGFAGVVALVGIVVGVVILVTGFVSYVDKVEDFDRTSVPGTLDVDITDTGGYSIYHEYDLDDFLVNEPTVEVTSPSGAPVDLDPYSATVTYTAGDHEGEGLFTFDADEVGTYQVTANGGDSFGSVSGQSGIAVGPGIGSGLVSAIVGGLLVGLLGLVAGVVIAVVVAVRRGRNKRAQTAAAAMAMGPQPSPWWNAPPPPQ